MFLQGLPIGQDCGERGDITSLLGACDPPFGPGLAALLAFWFIYSFLHKLLFGKRNMVVNLSSCCGGIRDL